MPPWPPVVEEAPAAVQQAAAVNMDETGWRQAQQRAWLWTVVTGTLTVFRIGHSRGGAEVEALLGTEFAGIVGSDRWSAYNRFPAERRALCVSVPARPRWRARPRACPATRDALQPRHGRDALSLAPELSSTLPASALAPLLAQNVVERTLRPAELRRKSSFGSDSEAGSRFVERLLTVIGTCRQQGRPLVDFLEAGGGATGS